MVVKRKQKSITQKVYEFIKKKKRVSTTEIYKKFHNEPESSIRRILHVLTKECVIYPLREWRPC